jgi:adenylate cyclase, class 2
MPLNLEIKVALKSLAHAESLLRKLKIKKAKTLIQKDVYYINKNGLLKLRVEGDSNVLIRYKRDEKGKNRWSNYELLTLTGKNPEKYLKNIFDIEAVVQKNRDLYLYKNTRIHLDKVKGLGCFLELETLLMDDKEDAKKRFDFLVKELELDTVNQIRKSYRDITIEKQKAKTAK